jgi:hypothetical protein
VFVSPPHFWCQVATIASIYYQFRFFIKYLLSASSCQCQLPSIHVVCMSSIHFGNLKKACVFGHHIFHIGAISIHLASLVWHVFLMNLLCCYKNIGLHLIWSFKNVISCLNDLSVLNNMIGQGCKYLLLSKDCIYS